VSRAAGFVTGGSSGIGLELARAMAVRGQDVAIFARDASRLDDARTILHAAAAHGTRVRSFACDVTDRAALTAAVDTAIAELGSPSHAIAAAGIATPGLFTEQDPVVHDQHMAVNYTGSRDFVAAVLPSMTARGAGRIGLISSAAAYFGIYGYSAYAPSKFAVRALAEVLTLELAPLGISVTHIAPPDTDTPMLTAENRTKPAASREITKAGGLWRPEQVAARTLAAMDRGRPEAPIGAQTAALARLSSVLAPVLRGWQARVIRRHGG